MRIQQVKDYNRDEMIRYSERVDEWKKEDKNNIIPQQAFFGFYTSQGNFRETGYVASEDKMAFWAKTKKEAINRLNDEQIENG